MGKVEVNQVGISGHGAGWRQESSDGQGRLSATYFLASAIECRGSELAQLQLESGATPVFE